MGNLRLCGGKGTHPYPEPVKALTDFLKKNSRMWPLVAYYVRDVRVDFDSETRIQKFEALTRRHRLKKPELSSLCDHLWRLLEALYALPSKDLDPRTVLLEHLLYVVGPYGQSLRQSRELQRGYQCSVHCGGTRIVESDATFDVAFLDCDGFEGHECKVKVSNYVPETKDLTHWDKHTGNKLRFMEETHALVVKTGRASAIYLTGLDRDLEPIQENLQRNGFSNIRVLGPDKLEELLV